MDCGKGERVYRFDLILVAAFMLCPGRKGINYFSGDGFLALVEGFNTYDKCIIFLLQIRSDGNLSGLFSSGAHAC